MSARKNLQTDLSLTQETYVEAIDELVRTHGHAHVSVLAEQLGVSKPSVVQMVGRLHKLGIVRRAGTEILLTEAGKRVAKVLGNRHALLREFMVEHLGMPLELAEEEACRLEHTVSAHFVQSLRRYCGRRSDSRE